MNAIVPNFAEQAGNRQTAPLEFLWIELSNACNLRCGHCYAESGPGRTQNDRLTSERILSLLAEARAVGCASCQFIGGEPQLAKVLPNYIAEAHRLGFKEIEIFSNLTFLRADVLAATKAAGAKFATSFYSKDPSLHDRITETVGSWAQTVRSIEKLVAEGVPLRAGIIVAPETDHLLEETKQFLRDMGVTNIGSDRVRAFGRAAEKASAADAMSMKELCGQCAGSVLCIKHDGSVAPCIMSGRWAVGSIVNASLADVLAGGKIAEVRRQIGEEVPRRGDVTACDPDGSGPGCYPSCNPQCSPNCYPGQQCSPCSPNSGQPCYPNGRCGPT